MNGLLFYVDGRLAPPDFFSARVQNTGAMGMVAFLIVNSDRLKADPKTVDAFEIRSGSIVRRYHCDTSKDESVTTISKTDDEPEKLRFTCRRVASTI